ncbi:MAG TPA: NlpC/P60 family protein, partial [Actinomycetota bacterium]|nr:NlpC/P60 family protein [Actinomycetota bacterium]
RLKAEAAQLNKLVLQTGPLLAQLRRADPTNPLLPTANGADRPGGPVVLPASWGTGRAWAAIRYAYAQLGKPYVWGATGPAAFDCSGLTLMAWAQAGVALPHFAAAQFAIGRPVTRSELQPGDLIFRNSPISHVAIYVGSGLQIAATHTGSTVKLQAAFSGDIVGYTRPDG